MDELNRAVSMLLSDCEKAGITEINRWGGGGGEGLTNSSSNEKELWEATYGDDMDGMLALFPDIYKHH